MTTAFRAARGVCTIALLAAFAAGCVDDGGDPETPADDEVDVSIVDAETDGMGADEGVDPDMVVDPDDGVLPDRGLDTDGTVDPDMAGDAAPPPVDMSMGLTIDSCEDACSRYEECGRIGDQFGDYETCLSDCGRISRGGRPDDWFDCVEIETCNLLRLCPVPEVQPLDCAEACELVEGCEVDLVIPDCAGTCEANGDVFRPCADLLYDGVCDGAGFAECIVRDVFPECRQLCDDGLACNLIREAECITDCLDDRLSGDPLGALRSQQLASCTRFIPDPIEERCDAADACFFPDDGAGGGGVDQAAFCRSYAECGFGEFFGCDEMVRELGDNLACGAQVMADGCPFSEFDMLDICFDGGGPDPRAAPCGRLCEAQEVCGVLPEGENRLGCTQDCLGAGGGDPDGVERADAVLPCGAVDRCPDLIECLAESGPGAECAAHCASLDGCGIGGDGCLAACDAQWPRDRFAAYRECVAGAADCDAMAACPLDPPPPCEAYCERLGPDGCFIEEDPGRCVASCDDGHFADPIPALQRVACVLTAEGCFDQGDGVPGAPSHDVQSCVFRAVDFGRDCLGFCRATTECVGDPEGLAPCLAACGAGLVGDEGLRFLAARDCLDGLPADAACDDVSACVTEDTNADCAALCDQALGCGLELAECPVRCLEDPLARLRSLRAESCIGPDDACPAVAACILPPVFEPAEGDEPIGLVPQDAFCVAHAACPDAQFFVGDCGFAYQDFNDGGGAAAVRCAYDVMLECPAILDPIFDCFRGEPPAPNPLIEPCAVLCEAQRFCDPDAPIQRDCEAACRDQLNEADPDSIIRLTPQMQCGSAWSCPELGVCLDAASPAAICADQCAAREACGQVGDVQDCAEECDAAFGRAREVGRRQCLDGVAADDCDAIAACEPPRALPCDLACAALEACGPGEVRCQPRCEDAGYRDPAGEAQRIACLVAAGDDCDAVAACDENPGAGGGACFAWCRATTECDPDAEEDLPACLTRCLTGFDDGDALRFASGEACLDAAGAAAECGELAACIPAEPVVDCDIFCGALDGCQIPSEDCLANCAAEPEEAVAVCVADALRTGQRCAGVARCVDYTPPAADDVCRSLCDAVTGCDDDVDPFLCRLECTPTPPAAAFQLACAEFSACGAELDACVQLDDTPVEACVGLCETAVDACGLYPDAAACIAECSGREAAAITPEGYLDRAGACFDESVIEGACDADAAAVCFQPAFCEFQDDLIFFQGDQGLVETDTTNRDDNYESPCAGGGAAEQVIVINVGVPSQITAEIIEADHDTAMNIRSPCDGAVLACDDDGGNGLLSRIDIEVEPGTYYLFIEGFSGRVGPATTDISVRPL